MPSTPIPACSFCGCTRDERAWLISGPAVYICEVCLRACTEVLAGEYQDPVKAELYKHLAPGSPNRSWLLRTAREHHGGERA